MKVLPRDFHYLYKLPLPWNRLVKKTILVSGANGFIASYLIKSLLFINDHSKNKIKIIGLVRNKKKAADRFKDYSGRKDLKILTHDVCNPLRLNEKISFIIHAASQASPKYYSIDPVGTLKSNVLGTYNLLQLAKDNPLESFLFISAGETYGSINSDHLTTEEEYGPLNPTEVRSCYAESKRMGETMCVAYHHQYKVPSKIVRLYHTYGPGVSLDDGRVFADFVSNIINNQNIVLKSDGKAIRSFTYIADAVSGFLTILFKGKNGEAYNLANEMATVSIKTLAKIIVDLFPEKKLRIIYEKRGGNDPYMQSKIQVNTPSSSKLMKLGWKPNFSLPDGFRRTIESFLEDP